MKEKMVKYFKEGVLTLVVSVLFSLILVLLSAMLFNLFGLDAGLVSTFNVIIKITSILFSIFVCFKTPYDGWIRGVVVGVLFTFLSHVLYGVISSNLAFGLSFVLDLLLGAVAGLVGGIIAVNVKRKSIRS